MQALGQELRFAARTLINNPGFTLVIIATLALGIGANTALFSVFHAVALKPLPYQEPERLVALWESVPAQQVTHNVVSSGNYLDWRDRNDIFEAMGAYSGTYPVALSGADRPEQIAAVTATPSMFHVLGVQPALGASIPPGNAEEFGDDWTLISHELWRSSFGADPAVIGRSVRVDDRPVTIAGVMPAGFQFPGRDVQIWLPRLFDERDRASRKGRQWKVIARLAPGLSLVQAREHMLMLTDVIRDEHPAEMDGWSVQVNPLHGDFVDGYTTMITAGGGNAAMLRLVMVVVGVILLIACANVAGLMLSRTAGRRHELATRQALGASKRRLMAGVFTECLLYAMAGTTAGVLLAHWGLNALIALGPADVPRLHEASISGEVLAFGAFVTIVTVVLVGLLPALTASGQNPAAALASGSRVGGGRSLHWQRVLVVTEVALACVLTAGAGLLTHSLVRLLQVDTGFEPAGVQLIGVPLPQQRYPDSDRQTRFHELVIEELGALPGTAAVAGTAEPPVVGHQMTFGFVVEGRRLDGPNEFEESQPVRAVTRDYFRVLRVPQISGRGFAAEDRAGSPAVAVVNQSFAQRHWPSESALGKRISLDGHAGPWIEVVGVVGDMRHNALDRPEPPVIYLPYAQKPWWWMSWMTYVIRAKPGIAIPAESIRDAIWRVDPQIAVGAAQSLESLHAGSSARRRFTTALLGAFGALALALSLIGIYGVLAHGVVRRHGEFGLRMAVGANRTAIFRLVMSNGMKLVVAGLAVGFVLALGFAQAISSQLFGVATLDPLTFTLMPVAMVSLALLACLLPAARAARIDPMQALRDE